MNKCVYVDLNYYMLVLFIIQKIYPLFSMSGFTLHHLIITCHHQLKKDRLVNEMSIQDYDRDINAWFKLQGIDIFDHATTCKLEFMVVNGTLVMYLSRKQEYEVKYIERTT